ncbi:unnamed protein product [Symbiodinium natans]|uniref:Uncharacterized protein n=1 Tax=Symbiodinium natans TaxID=878477 RepID=A0A812RVP7_9DINO|nr:unnamed protein product [Symbiodinium natans]
MSVQRLLPQNEVDAPSAYALGGAALMIAMLFSWYWFQSTTDADVMLLGIAMAFYLLFLPHPCKGACAPTAESEAEAKPLLEKLLPSSSTMPIPGKFWSSMSISAMAVYLAASYLARYEVQECVWQVLLISTLCGSCHLSLSCLVDWPSLAALPVIANACLLPLVTQDRVPFSFLPPGCPPSTYYVMMAYTLILAAALWPRQPFSISIVHQPSRSWKPEVHSSRFAFCFEIVPIACATLSVVYLACCLKWSGSGTGYHDSLSDIIYHVAWAWLRPAYFFIFGLYWLAIRPVHSKIGSLMCGFGVAYFGCACALADTSMTHHFNSMCIAGHSLPVPLHGTYGQNWLGQAAHHTERDCFYFSMVLCVSFFRDVDLGERAWSLWRGAMAVAFGVMGLVRFFEFLGHAVAFDVWVITHYYLGYFAIIFVEGYALLTQRCHYVIFVAHASVQDEPKV